MFNKNLQFTENLKLINNLSQYNTYENIFLNNS